MPLDVGIVGAGFAGTAAALFLGRSGHRVTLYEEAERPRAIGAGILMQPSGLRVLGELGLLRSVLARGARVDELVCKTARGRSVLDLRYADYRSAWFGLGMHRGALFEILFQELRERGVVVHCGASVTRYEQRGSGSRLFARSGELLGEHQLLIVADGARSELREQTFPGAARRYPWGALWFVARDPEQRFAGRLHQIADGTSTLLGLLPSGSGPSDGDGTPLVSLFWSIRTEAAERHVLDLDAWKRRVLELEPASAEVLDQVSRAEALLPAAYHDVLLPRYHDHGIVFIGDAAHATSPQLGQGCNLALEDARVLDRCLDIESSLPAALELYSRARRRHVAYYQFASRALTPFFQSRHRVLGGLRDALLGSLCRFPPTRKLMLSTLSGVQRGLAGTLPLAPIAAALRQAP